jgi:two-component system, OmpR family, response regulator
MRLLLIEADPEAAKRLAKCLQDEGFVVDVAPTGEAGEEQAVITDYDVIVLEGLLPGKDGIAICQTLRAADLATPILMLTADSLADRVTGLTSGADDCLAKPFAFAELLARVRALLRRSRLTRPAILRVTDLTLDPASHRVTRAGARIRLTAKEYMILEVLMRNAGETVSRKRLVEHVWEDESEVPDNVVDVHLGHLRKKIDRGSGPALIHTVRGFGYQLAPKAPDALEPQLQDPPLPGARGGVGADDAPAAARD